jgi:hypothetical protein
MQALQIRLNQIVTHHEIKCKNKRVIHQLNNSLKRNSLYRDFANPQSCKQ